MLRIHLIIRMSRKTRAKQTILDFEDIALSDQTPSDIRSKIPVPLPFQPVSSSHVNTAQLDSISGLDIARKPPELACRSDSCSVQI